MTTKRLPSRGEVFTATVGNLATAYGVDEQQIHVAVYALAEQIHRQSCLSRGIVNHQEARPDQSVAVAILSALAGTDWWLVRQADRRPAAAEPADVVEPTVFQHYGDDSVMGWADPDESTT